MTTDTPLIWIARHGTTTDSNKKIFRGNRDSMLDRQGFLDAHELKEFFSNKTWKHLVCSDMTRSIQTATIIGEPRDETPIVLKDLDPWHIGYLTGKDKKQFKPDMEVFIEHPDMRPQDGETRNEFFGRTNPLFIAFMYLAIRQGAPVLMGGTSSSVIHALAHLLWGEGHPPLAVEPGGVIEVFLTKKGQIDARPVLKPGKDDSSFADGQPTS